VVSFVKGGLKDLSISRTSFSWGVKVPSSEKHVMYVWLDALANYLSALGFPDENAKLYQDFWVNGADSPLHIVGKDIVRFHAVYWPAFLMAANLNIPHTVYAHGWWTNEGQKISKSVGNVISPIGELEWLESFGISREVAIDYFRYFLLREVPFGNDGDYSRTSFVARVNSELANNIGNLAQRSLSMIFKNSEGKIVDFSTYEEAAPLLKSAYLLQENVQNKMANFAFDQAINEVISHASKCNEWLNLKAPWNLKKENKIEEMNLVLSVIAENLRVIAIALQPFCINLAPKILDVLQIANDQRNIDFIDAKYSLKPEHKINEPKAIFPRLENKTS
jgi:methionyl-tRNA synthetase